MEETLGYLGWDPNYFGYPANLLDTFCFEGALYRRPLLALQGLTGTAFASKLANTSRQRERSGWPATPIG